MSGTPGPDGRHDDLGEDELAGLALLVPDDPRSLDADRNAYLDELRDRARPPHRSLLNRLGSPRRLDRFGVTGAILLVTVLTIGLVGGLMSAFSGRSGLDVPQTPLASAPAADVGKVGGLLPAIDVSNRAGSAPLRSLRPGLVILIQGACLDCKAILHSLVLQAQEYRLDFVVAGPGSQTGDLEALERDALGSAATVALDAKDVLTQTYQPTGVTVILVHADGIVGQIDRDVTADQRLEPALAQLSRPGATA